MSKESRRVGLKWKIAGVYTGMILILAVVLIAATYHLTDKILRDQLDKRALAIATNLSDAAAGHIVGRNLLALHTLARKYTLLDGVAYAFITDDKGEIVAHTFGALPAEIRQGPSSAEERQVRRRELSVEGKTVYETRVPILEGQAGGVHVGFWSDAAQIEIRSALLPIIAVIAVVLVVGALFSFLMAHWIVRPIVGLTMVADKVTKGDLETSVSGEFIESRDEIGDLARSLERMRSSLRAAMLRLNREVA
jgi:HAMP domain-containing protein